MRGAGRRVILFHEVRNDDFAALEKPGRFCDERSKAAVSAEFPQDLSVGLFRGGEDAGANQVRRQLFAVADDELQFRVDVALTVGQRQPQQRVNIRGRELL